MLNWARRYGAVLLSPSPYTRLLYYYMTVSTFLYGTSSGSHHKFYGD
jgi:hypothetical protein